MFRPMHISIDHKFQFIHVPKTAGATIAKVLAPYCEERSAVTSWRRLMTKVPVRENYSKALIKKHYTARWSRIKLGRRLYDDLFSFAFVRNPFDRMVSRYEYIRNEHLHHRHEDVVRMDFSQFLIWEASRNSFKLRDQASCICDFAGNVIIDEIYRFEDLNEGVRRMTQRIGIPTPDKIGWENKQDRMPYADYYKPADIDRVAQTFRRDLKLLHYDF